MQKLTSDDKKYIIQCLAKQYGRDEESLRAEYSGRGMYGSTSYGIITDSPDELIEEAETHGLTGALTDDVGMSSTIVYWQNINN
jgi:hypothetical protein